ncbi:MAG: sortase [Clostridia bacterium]|nr:sortase [Clostridia bacterium]
MENKYGNLLSIMLIVAIVIVVVILGFFGYKVYNSNKTNKKAEDVVSQFDKNTDNTNNEDKDSSNNNSSEADGNNSSLQDILDNLGNDNSNSIYQQQGNKDTYYEGYKVIGTISIPSIDVEYPILEENTSATLKIAIVAVYPQDPANAVNKPGNLVLWGHNYKNGTFFSDIGKLTTGAKIYIKDTSGTKLEYQVYNSYETTDSDMTYATRETNGAREITLSTCSNESGKRIIVYAKQT